LFRFEAKQQISNAKRIGNKAKKRGETERKKNQQNSNEQDWKNLLGSLIF
jgi:transcriptional regulator of nitric oxide reductase